MWVGAIITKIASIKIENSHIFDLKTIALSDLNENICNSKERQLVMHGYKRLYEGDLNEIVNVNEGKLVMHEYKILNGSMGRS